MIAEVAPLSAAPVVQRISRPGRPRLWTVDEYLAIVAAGILGPDDRVELLEGEIIEKMPQDFPHINGIEFLVEALRAAFNSGFYVRSQMPQRTPDSVPEPDVLLLKGSHRDFVGRFPNPEEIVLVVEVSNTTLDTDRRRKLGIYARAGFVEYWILNVADRQLEIHRNPLPSGVYAEARILGEGETVTIEGREVRVADFLP